MLSTEINRKRNELYYIFMNVLTLHVRAFLFAILYSYIIAILMRVRKKICYYSSDSRVMMFVPKCSRKLSMVLPNAIVLSVR